MTFLGPFGGSQPNPFLSLPQYKKKLDALRYAAQRGYQRAIAMERSDRLSFVASCAPAEVTR